MIGVYIKYHKGILIDIYKPSAAWNRAIIYFLFCNIISVITGTFQVILTQPIASAEQLVDPFWIFLCVICFSYIFIAYWILWARMTLTFERKYFIGSEIFFGLLWGLSAGQLLLSFFHLWNMTGFPAWAVYLLSFGCMGVWQYFFQYYYWDVYVSPEHDTPRSIILKTLISHIPNVAICLLFLIIYNNYLIYVATQIFALVASSIFQKFPAPWAKEEFHAPMTKPGIFGLPGGTGYTGENKKKK